MTPPGRAWALALPYDRPPLSLNREMHWAKRRQAERQIMDDVQWLARQQKLPRGKDALRRIHVRLVWTPSVKRTRDTDNPTPTLKKVIDGLVRYGLVMDDHHDIVSSECVINAIAHGRGHVVVAIQEILPDEAVHHGEQALPG